MTLQDQIQGITTENTALQQQVSIFKDLTEKLLTENFQLQTQNAELTGQKLTDVELDIMAQGQHQTDIEIAQIEQSVKISELENKLGEVDNV